jgi:hypothetical protein
VTRIRETHTHVALTEAVFTELSTVRTDVHAGQHPVLTASGGHDVDVALGWYANMYGGIGALQQYDARLVPLVIRVALGVVFIELGVLG